MRLTGSRGRPRPTAGLAAFSDALKLRRFRALTVLLAGAVLVLWLGTGSAWADDFTWSGGSTTSGNWSDGANWQGGVPPAPGGSIGTLAFTSDCFQTACDAHNDVKSLVVDQLDLQPGFTLDGDAITLHGALSSSNAGTSILTDVELPIKLDASESWSTGAGSELQFGSVTGTSPLLIDNIAGYLYMNNAEVGGQISIEGGNLGGELNYDDGKPVDLTDVTLHSSSLLGPLTMHGGLIDFSGAGWPFPSLGDVFASSAALDSSTGFELDFGSELRSTGTVSLNGAGLYGGDYGGGCPPGGAIGQSRPLVSTSGTLNGSFGSTADGVFFPEHCRTGYRIRYDRVSSPRTVSATVVGPSKTSVACGTRALAPGESMRCEVTVSDGEAFDPSRPTGHVWVHSDVSKKRLSCVLGAVSKTRTACRVTLPVDYASLQGSRATVIANYPGDAGHLGSSGSTDVTVNGGGGSLVAFPIEAREGKPFADKVVGLLVVPRGSGSSPQASDYVASVDWGDAAGSAGRVVKADSRPGEVVFKILASHRYDSTGPTSFTMQVRHPRSPAISSQGRVLVDSRDPQAFFVANPVNPRQDGIGLLIPKASAPDQEKIIARQWDLGDGNRVLDDRQTRPMYFHLLAKLRAHPGNDALRKHAIAIGILPEDANGGPGGFGGLSSDQVRQVAQVWQTYFPYHIVPHLWDYYTSSGGGVGVKLTTKDARGALSEYSQNLSVSRDCQPWGGPLSALIPGRFNTCDTWDGFHDLWNGIAVQFGPHRDADYMTLDINLTARLRWLNVGGGASVSIMPGSSPLATRVFLTLHGSAGVGLPTESPLGPASTSVSWGWAGPPDANRHPTGCQIANFIGGPTFSGGFTLGIGFLGAGFTAVYSPGGSQPGCDGYTVGEEYSLGTLGVDEALGVACSAPISNIDNAQAKLAYDLYNAWSEPSKHVDPKEFAQHLQDFQDALIRSTVSLATAAIEALKQCAPG